MHERDLSSTSTYVTHHLGDLIDPQLAGAQDALGVADYFSSRLDLAEVARIQHHKSGGSIEYEHPQDSHPSHFLDLTLPATIAARSATQPSLDGLRRMTTTTQDLSRSSNSGIFCPTSTHLSFPPAPTFPRLPAVSHHPTYSLRRTGYPSSQVSAPPFTEFQGVNSTVSSNPDRSRFQQELYEEYDGTAEEDFCRIGMREDPPEPSSAASRGYRAAGDGMGDENRFQHGVGYDRHTPWPKMSDARKARRIRRLERKFGRILGSCGEGDGSRAMTPSSIKERIAAAKGEKARQKDELEFRSGVDVNGQLIVSGPNKRMALKWSQAIGAVIVGFGSIGATTLTHPISTPPPRGRAPLYALFFLPFVSVASTIYLFVFRPIVYRRHARSSIPSEPVAAFAEMVLPVLRGSPDNARGPARYNGKNGRAGGGGWLSKSLQGGKGSRRMLQQPIVFVDPTRLADLAESASKLQDGSGGKHRRTRRERERRRRHKRKKAEQDREGEDLISSSSATSLDESDTGSSSDAWSASERRASKTSRKALLSVVILEERWKAARSWAKKVTLVQACLGVLWSGVGIWSIGFGERCTPGTMEGYCNLYNLALAFTALTAASFLVGSVLNLVDLQRTRYSPRLRQQRHGV